MKRPTKRDVKFFSISVIGILLFLLVTFLLTCAFSDLSFTDSLKRSLKISMFFILCGLIIGQIESIFEKGSDTAKGVLLGGGIVALIWLYISRG